MATRTLKRGNTKVHVHPKGVIRTYQKKKGVIRRAILTDTGRPTNSPVSVEVIHLRHGGALGKSSRPSSSPAPFLSCPHKGRDFVSFHFVSSRSLKEPAERRGEASGTETGPSASSRPSSARHGSHHEATRGRRGAPPDLGLSCHFRILVGVEGGWI